MLEGDVVREMYKNYMLERYVKTEMLEADVKTEM